MIAGCPVSTSIVRGSQPLAAFGSTSLEYELATLCAHAHAEAMRLGPATIIGLKSPLHAIHLSIDISTNFQRYRMAGEAVKVSRFFILPSGPPASRISTLD
jgi:hypothetical protein